MRNAATAASFCPGVEIQVLDSYDNVSYADGQAGAMYGQHPRLVNASRGLGQWQSYHIVFTAPRFKGATLETPAILTVLHNGILVHNAKPFWGPTAHKRMNVRAFECTRTDSPAGSRQPRALPQYLGA